MRKHVEMSDDKHVDLNAHQSEANARRPKKRKGGDASKPSVKVVATIFHETKQESYYLVRYRTVDGAKDKLLVGRELSSSQILSLLLKNHAELPDDREDALGIVEEAILERDLRQYRITSRTGWYGDSFVYLTRTFGPLARKLRHEGRCDIDPALGQSHGTVKAWRDGMRTPAKYSDFLVFALSVPASGPLLDCLGQHEGAVYHFQPKGRANVKRSNYNVGSSSGKTLAARAGLSEIGRCQKNDLVTFAATERAVEDYCYAHNDLLGVFDEEGRGLSATNSIKRASLPYQVTSGAGKLRSKKAIQDSNLQNLKWAIQVLSTGEIPLDDPKKIAERPEGARVRMIPIPVPPAPTAASSIASRAHEQ